MGQPISVVATAERKKTLGAIMNSNRIPNVLLIGASGSGKSSLATSLETSFTRDPTREVAPAGPQAVTARILKKLELFKDLNMRIDGYSFREVKTHVPVFYEMPSGFQVKSRSYKTFLRCVLGGRVPPDKPLKSGICDLTEDEVQKTFAHADESRLIDRVIFVVNAEEDIATTVELTSLVKELCDELDITLFSLVSRYDSWNQRKSIYDNVSDALGTSGSPRRCHVTLYHENKSDGKYKNDNKTNYYMYLLIRNLLNPHYTIHSIN